MPSPLTRARQPGMGRRDWLQLCAAGGLAAAWAGPAPAVSARRTLAFPRDHGSHPDWRTEWWYVTGQAQAAGRLWGFQVTFFRSRVDATQNMQSAFAARQLLFAHAALTDLEGRRLLHDQRIARVGFGIARASESDTDIRLQDWSLQRTALPVSPAPPAASAALPGNLLGSRYLARVEGTQFGLALQCDTTQPTLLQGQQGLSRKGPQAAQASYYYSQPQLAVSGSIVLNGQRMAIDNTPGATQPARAWMDHEWSESLLHPEAVGWDWVGMNLRNGSALTAFRLRRADGTTLWAGGSFRAPGQPVQVFDAAGVVFTAERWWTSPHSGARYPVQWRIATPAGAFRVNALLDSQELDSSGSTGAIYWEGLSVLTAASQDTLASQPDPRAAEVIGQGYLEMTGYAQPLRL